MNASFVMEQDPCSRLWEAQRIAADTNVRVFPAPVAASARSSSFRKVVMTRVTSVCRLVLTEAA